MGRPYSADLRTRIVAAVEGEISRTSAARQFAVGVKCDFQSFVYGWYAALVFVALYNVFAPRRA